MSSTATTAGPQQPPESSQQEAFPWPAVTVDAAAAYRSAPAPAAHPEHRSLS